MNKEEYPFAIALTGGIATGKSTLKSLLFLEGFAIIEADLIAHKVLDNSVDFVKNTFGNEFIDNAKVNRAELGKLIFANNEKKLILEKYIHPLIEDEIKLQSNKLEQKKFPYLIDIPLYFETDTFHLSKVIVVWTEYKLQLQRLMKRNNLTEKEAILRIKAQIPIAKKAKKADFIVNNNNDLKFLQKECALLIEYINDNFVNNKV